MSSTPKRHGTPRADAAVNHANTHEKPHAKQEAPAPKAKAASKPQAEPKPRAEAYIPTANAAYAASGKSKRRKQSKGSLAPVLIALLVVALVVGGGVVLWTTHPIKVTLNGATVEVKKHATPDDLVAASEATYKAGNLVSVGGNVISEGKGTPYTLTVNGEVVEGEQLTDFQASPGDTIDLSDGGDIMEDYTATVTEVQPKLALDGNWGSLSYVSQWGRVGKIEERTGAVSGEVAQTTTQEVQDCIITIRNPKPTDGSKLVALTFDDGPSDQFTQRYLDILNEYNVKATFFCLGSKVEAYPELANAIVAQGSQLASHTYSHSQLTTLDTEALQGEFSSAFGAISSATGVNTTVFRPPYGDFRQGSWIRSGGLATVSVLWTQDSEDWRRAGAESIVEKSTAGVTPGSIILMHDGGGDREQDVEALPSIISTLQEQGYTFVTIDELMASDESIPAEIASGNATMPEDAVWPTEAA